jgi:hypothetical protein
MDTIWIIVTSIGGGIALLLIVACIVCMLCHGCLVYTTLNKLWDLAGKAVDKIEEKQRNRALRRARAQRDKDLERGDESSDISSVDFDHELRTDQNLSDSE